MAAFFYSRGQEPIYEAKATILVQYRGTGFVPGLTDISGSQQLANTYRRLLMAKPFLERVERNEAVPFDSGRLSRMVSADTGTSPPVIEIRVRHSDPDVAATTAQTVADEFIVYAVEQRLAEIARLQSAAAAQGIENVQDLVAAQFTAVDSLSFWNPSPLQSRQSSHVLVKTYCLARHLGLY